MTLISTHLANDLLSGVADGACLLEKNKRFFEPPINTDEHRLKDDKCKRYNTDHLFFLIMPLSVFIGVHRWLKKGINPVNQNFSVSSFLGSL